MRIKYLVAFLLIISISACEFDDADLKYNLGNDFITDPTNVIMIDTFTIKTYTVVSDSLVTSRANRLLTGKVENQYGIETYCEAYFRFDPCGLQTLHSTAQFDSICFIFNLDGYKSGDTTMVGEFEVYRLIEDIDYDEDTYMIYNSTQFESESSPLASFSIDYSEDEYYSDVDYYSDDVGEISMRLPDALGEELFNEAKEDYPDSIIFDADSFIDYFKGFVIKPVANNASFVFGIKAIADSLSAPRMRIYYSDYTTDDELYFDFPLENEIVESLDYSNIYAFSYIQNDYAGTFLEGIEPDESKIPSTETDNISIIQGGAMLAMRIEIPYISNLYELGIGTIVKAELYLEPLEGTYDLEEDLPSILQMIRYNDENGSSQYLYTAGTEEVEFGQLYFDDEFNEETQFEYDITDFIIAEYGYLDDTEYYLTLYVPYDSQLPDVDQLILGDTENIENRLRLKVYLTKF